MTIILTILALCIYSTISIVGIYLLTCALLGRSKKYTSYIVMCGYLAFILINIFIWICSYKWTYVRMQQALESLYLYPPESMFF